MDEGLMFNVENWRTNKKNLESTIGRLNHTGYIIPQSRYFLNRLRNLLKRCKQYGPQTISIKEIKDIELWIRLLNKVSTKGVDINNITLSRATDTTFSDACETGMGGFSTDGMAWRYALPERDAGHFLYKRARVSSCNNHHIHGATRQRPEPDNSGLHG